jgi:hypothetical protein
MLELLLLPFQHLGVLQLSSINSTELLDDITSYVGHLRRLQDVVSADSSQEVRITLYLECETVALRNAALPNIPWIFHLFDPA